MVFLGPVYAIVLALVVWVVVYFLGQKITSTGGKIALRVAGYLVLVYVIASFYVTFMME